nr:pre-60S factor REI1 [Kwoniella mangroviensis CBS 8507]OCF68914.1 pre-60S factor REI1 [Kwoniella mangroviensis CBS 8507]
MFTCISCRVAFETAAEQRSHFSTDWHRYNMKRRVANLPPVAAESFNEKVLERREQNAVRTDPRSLSCASCSKNFSSENAFRSHVQSKKHRDREAQQSISHASSAPHSDHHTPQNSYNAPSTDVGHAPSDSESEEEEDGDFSARIAKARRRIQPTDCLFCPSNHNSVDDNTRHMAKSHSFFIPDQDILLDLPGLLSYLGEKVAVGNLCLYCPNGGREFGSLEAVRKHMVDKAHCKLAYETEEDRAELADYYDFAGSDETADSDWEDLEDNMSDVSQENPMPDQIKQQRQISLAPDGLSLVLPSGRTLGHRSLKIYYSQRLRPVLQHDTSTSAISAAKVALVRQRLADPSLALVPVAGGHGAFGRGQELMKARNAGEAKWAKRQGRSFKDQRLKEQFKTKVGYVHNNQKRK